MAQRWMCKNCGYEGTKYVVKGSFLIEVILWLFFIIPGLIYSLWRLTSGRRTKVCPSCGADNMIPASSPLAGQTQIHPKPVIHRATSARIQPDKDPIWMTVIRWAFGLLFLSGGVMQITTSFFAFLALIGIAFILLPPGLSAIEKKKDFYVPFGIKAILVVALMAANGAALRSDRLKNKLMQKPPTHAKSVKESPQKDINKTAINDQPESTIDEENNTDDTKTNIQAIVDKTAQSEEIFRNFSNDVKLDILSGKMDGFIKDFHFNWGTPEQMRITVNSSWHRRGKNKRTTDLQLLRLRWKSYNLPEDRDKAHVTLYSENGKIVGGEDKSEDGIWVN